MNATEAGQIAFDFLMADLEIPEDEQEWFEILESNFSQQSWYTVKIGLEGLPDQWILQVFDTGVCDPCYTFNSPIKAADGSADLDCLPESIATTLMRERNAT